MAARRDPCSRPARGKRGVDTRGARIERTLAGYLNLRNSGDAALTVVGADSVVFRSVSMHQSVEENGVERMRTLAKFAIAPGESVTFAPGGKHLMLMQPVRQLKSGDAVRIHIATESGEGANADFIVRDSAP
jgi:copper(I)-binding protein